MFHLKVHLHLTEQLKLHKKVKKKDAFDVAVDGPLKGGCTHLFVR